LLNQVRERIRQEHYSLRTAQSNVRWVTVFMKGDARMPKV